MDPYEFGDWLRGVARRVVLFAVVVIALALLAACGGGDPEPDKRAEPPKCGAPGVCV